MKIWLSEKCQNLKKVEVLGTVHCRRILHGSSMEQYCYARLGHSIYLQKKKYSHLVEGIYRLEDTVEPHYSELVSFPGPLRVPLQKSERKEGLVNGLTPSRHSANILA